MSSGSSPRAQNRRRAQVEAAAALFRKGYTYRYIAQQLDITVAQAEAKVKSGLGEDPKLFRRSLQ